MLNEPFLKYISSLIVDDENKDKMIELNLMGEINILLLI